MSKLKLIPSQKIILRNLIFVESFHHIKTETGYDFGTIRDDLIQLINHGFVEVYDEKTELPISPFYDSDNINHFSFKATKTGLKKIQQHAI